MTTDRTRALMAAGTLPTDRRVVGQIVRLHATCDALWRRQRT